MRTVQITIACTKGEIQRGEGGRETETEREREFGETSINTTDIGKLFQC